MGYYCFPLLLLSCIIITIPGTIGDMYHLVSLPQTSMNSCLQVKVLTHRSLWDLPETLSPLIISPTANHVALTRHPRRPTAAPSLHLCPCFQCLKCYFTALKSRTSFRICFRDPQRIDIYGPLNMVFIDSVLSKDFWHEQFFSNNSFSVTIFHMNLPRLR